MAPKVKDRIINAMIYIVSGVTVALVMLFVNNNNAEAKENEEKMDSKLDKIEFIEFKKDNAKALLKLEADREHDLTVITDHFDKRVEDIKELIRQTRN